MLFGAEAGHKRSLLLLYVVWGFRFLKPQIIVPSSCSALLYRQFFFCQGKIEPTLTIHKKRHCRKRCWSSALIMQWSRIPLLHAKLLVLSAPNMRLWARLEAERWELEGEGGSLPRLGEGGGGGERGGEERWNCCEGAEGWVWMNRRDMADLAIEQLNLIGGCAYYSSSLVINTGTSVHLLV